MFKQIIKELRNHAPFTIFGALTGIVIMAFCWRLPFKVSYNIFYTLHPIHVFFSALVTASMYELHKCGRIKGKCNLGVLIVIGYVGSIGIATMSDSVIPYLGERMLGLPDRGIHLGFIEKWWLVNPMAILGIAVAYFKPSTKFPHAGHVLLSTWASLFHIIMALGREVFISVWIPCCVSDIVFPLLFVKPKRNNSRIHSH